MRMKKGILGVAVTLAVAGLGLWPGTVANAGETAYNDYTSALAGAPQGVDLNSDEYKDYFWHGDDATGATGANSAALVDAGSTGANTSAIRISRAGDTNTWGAIWSNDKVFDLMKPQTASMWVYASTEAAYVKAGLGDGMAFVLQNSGDGVHAFSKAGMPDKDNNTVYTPGTGESMGVWGMDPKDWHSTDLAKNAISNSWALEFDTFNNTYDPPTKSLILGATQWSLNAPYAPSSFDLGSYYNSFDASGNPTGAAGTIKANDNHIASNYPGDSATYTGVARDGTRNNIWGKNQALFGGGEPKWYDSSDYPSSSYYFYKMTHLGYLDEGKMAETSDRLTDHRWHHVTLTYTPPTSVDGIGKMEYVYDDKDSDTGADKTPANSAEVPIKLSEFNLKDSTKVRWGFTGSTGTSTENNLVVFDQVPGDVENSSSATLSTQDDSGNYNPVDTTSTPTLSGGTAVKLDYNFQRDGGLKDWEGINASLTIPKSIQLTSGKITNPDGSVDSVDISKLSGTNLPVALGSDGKGLTLTDSQGGKITLYGQVADVDANEDSTSNYFQGSNASSTATLGAFKVKKSDLQFMLDPTSAYNQLRVNYDTAAQQAVVAGVVKYPVGDEPGSLTSKDITIHLKVNGVSQGSKNLLDDNLSNGVLYGFNYPIDNNLLKAGKNTVTLYATSTAGDVSSSDSATVTAGTFGYGDTSGSIVFEPTTLNGANTTIKRANNWSFNIDDSRVSGSKDWKLSAKTDGMFLDDNTAVKTPLDGYLEYVDSKGVHPLSGDLQQIATGKADDADLSTDIAKNWTSDTGILLNVSGNAVQGNYKGNIEWDLTDSVS